LPGPLGQADEGLAVHREVLVALHQTGRIAMERKTEYRKLRQRGTGRSGELGLEGGQLPLSLPWQVHSFTGQSFVAVSTTHDWSAIHLLDYEHIQGSVQRDT
jgi:hypothetical protein